MTHKIFRQRQAAFTAIEVITVATIIAILALIIVPIVRGRVEQAKETAAIDDMKQIETAQSLASADTGYTFRLHDLRRNTADETDTAVNQRATVPPASWNTVFGLEQMSALTSTWLGPHLALHRSKDVGALWELYGNYLFHESGQAGGPILILTSHNVVDDLDETANDNDAYYLDYPLDPWGQPYIYFGQGYVDLNNGVMVTETNFSTSIVYSLGSDGVPGFAGTWGTNGIYLYRESGTIGADGSDDLYREF